MVTFKSFGLNKFRNMLVSPRCDCGCGEKICLATDDVDDVLSLADDMLRGTDINPAAVFVTNDDGYYAMVKCWSNEDAWEQGMLNGAEQNMELFRLSKESGTFHSEDEDYPANEFFCFVDQLYHLNAYGLMIETKNGYEIVED